MGKGLESAQEAESQLSLFPFFLIPLPPPPSPPLSPHTQRLLSPPPSPRLTSLGGGEMGDREVAVREWGVALPWGLPVRVKLMLNFSWRRLSWRCSEGPRAPG